MSGPRRCCGCGVAVLIEIPGQPPRCGDCASGAKPETWTELDELESRLGRLFQSEIQVAKDQFKAFRAKPSTQGDKNIFAAQAKAKGIDAGLRNGYTIAVQAVRQLKAERVK